MATRYSSFDIETTLNIQGPTKKIVRVSNLITSCLMCLFCLVNIILLLIILTSHLSTVNKNVTELMPMVDYISNNLKSAPVMDIELAKNNKCSSNETFTVLSTWPGTVKGCYCKATGVIYAGQCTKSDKAKCSEVNPTDPKAISVWNTDSYCLRRADSANYYIKPFEGNCSTKYNDCGMFCVKSEASCPITNLTIIEDNNAGENQESLSLTQGRVLVISRDKTALPIYNMEISFHDKPCLQPEHLPVGNITNYLLLNIDNLQGCGLYGVDYSGQIIETSKVSNVIKDNKLTNVENLPLYISTEGNSDVYLLTRPRLSLSSQNKCQILLVPDSSSVKLELFPFRSWVIASSIIPLIAMSIYAMYLAYISFDEIRRKYYRSKIKKLASWVIFTGCFLGMIAYNRILSEENAEIVEQQTIYSDIAASNCFEDVRISNALSEFAVSIPKGTENVMDYVSVMFWSSIFFYVSAILTVALSHIYQTQHEPHSIDD